MKSDPIISSQGSICPSCGRSITTRSACPYCGYDLTGRRRQKLIRVVVLASFLCILPLLWWAWGGSSRPPEPPAGDRRERGSMRIDLSGRVARIEGDNSGGASLWVDHLNGTARIMLPTAVARNLRERAGMPAVGDRITAAAFLREDGEPLVLTVESPEDVVVEHGEFLPVPIARLDEQYRGKRVCIAGRIVGSRTFNGGTGYMVSDGTSLIELVIRDSSRSRFVDRIALLRNGRDVIARGVVGDYGSPLQMAISLPDDLKEVRTTQQIAPDTPRPSLKQKMSFHRCEIGDLPGRSAGELVEVTGKITSAIAIPDLGIVMLVTDPSGSVSVLARRGKGGNSDDPRFGIGKLITVRGRLDEARQISADPVTGIMAAELVDG